MRSAALATALWMFSLPAQAEKPPAEKPPAEKPPAEDPSAETPPAKKRPAFVGDLPKFSENPEGLGLGFGVGEPMGLAVAFRPNPDHTIAAMMGWSLTRGSLHLHADYLVTLKEIRPTESTIAVSLYAGVGPTIDIGSRSVESGFGVRIPAGVSVAFDKPVDIFAEFAPVLGAIPDLQIYAAGTVGARVWFQPKQGSSLDRLRSHDALNKRQQKPPG
jgi:hypothetical protein